MKIRSDIFWALARFASTDEYRSEINHLYQRQNQLEATNGHIAASVQDLTLDSDVSRLITCPAEDFQGGLADGFYHLKHRVEPQDKDYPDYPGLLEKHGRDFNFLFTVKQEDLPGAALALRSIYDAYVGGDDGAMTTYAVLDGESNQLVIYFSEIPFFDLLVIPVKTEQNLSGEIVLGGINPFYLALLLELCFYVGCPATFRGVYSRSFKEDLPSPWVLYGISSQYKVQGILMPISTRWSKCASDFYSLFANEEVMA